MEANDRKVNLSIVIRPTKQEDFDDILPLLKQLWPANPLDLKAAHDIFAKGLASDQRAYLCACHDGRIIGFCTLIVRDCLWLQGDVGYLCDLVVDQEHRGSGDRDRPGGKSGGNCPAARVSAGRAGLRLSPHGRTPVL